LAPPRERQSCAGSAVPQLLFGSTAHNDARSKIDEGTLHLRTQEEISGLAVSAF
jgi:hypothetical protein